MNEGSVLVLGVGNLLLSDEGVGVHVARRLQQMELPAWVEVVDGGTGGFELINFCHGRKKIIIVDAILTEAEPGTLFRLRPEDIVWPELQRYSAHHAGLVELIRQCRTMMPSTEVILFGVVPQEIDRVSMNLSPVLEERLEKIAAMVVEETTRL
jgi:hydrogenase maturation protease